ncbi:peroxiredoxin [Azorhizobium oxalatiphilum]|uniref:Peroxiredoxin n=1 Tax=Azorhizobium oxalatiphilum TaxID=980631 RepID=A0A917C8X9_9HYPH|nr:peroxiredoxin [Azorhizobium oxalatiphilum]GGF74311.1 peroxiredoxin [Azorhizobium oxalatiphilum]
MPDPIAPDPIAPAAITPATPEDDGAADHLPGLELPIIPLMGTHGHPVDLSDLSGRVVVYAYPKTGRPDMPTPDGWDSIPGARGCTPQSCSFRDSMDDLRSVGIEHVFGLSVQDTGYQQEAATRLVLPFPLLSDHRLEFARAVRLPTFAFEGALLLKRLTMVIEDGAIAHVFYPVHPPQESAQQVVAFLRAHDAAQEASRSGW